VIHSHRRYDGRIGVLQMHVMHLRTRFSGMEISGIFRG
jgi:hypothetical protein